MREMTYEEAEKKAVKVLVDGIGEALVLEGEGGFYALYYLFRLQGLKAPHPEETPDWVEGPRSTPEGFRHPYDQARWLEQNGYTLFVNESK